jgi:hypothetical protein
MENKYKLDGDIEREFTAEEYAQAQLDETEYLVKEQAKAEAAAKRTALLARLGITEEEATLLLGGN